MASAGGGKTSDEVVFELADSVLSRLPDSLNVDEAPEAMFQVKEETYRQRGMQVVEETTIPSVLSDLVYWKERFLLLVSSASGTLVGLVTDVGPTLVTPVVRAGELVIQVLENEEDHTDRQIILLI